MTPVIVSHRTSAQDELMVPRSGLVLRVLPSTVAPSPDDRASTQIYRPFFLAGILTVLTAGCLLGAVALFGIAQQASYTASAWTPYILAHANSQLFGWVGFFIMGFALQQHAPTVGRSALFHRLAYGSLGLMAAGIALRFVAEPMTAVDRDVWMPVGVLSGLLQFAAVMLFVVNTSTVRYRTKNALTWPTAFVFSSRFWLVVVAAAEPVVFALSHQADAQASVVFVAEWFTPLREAQFLGFVAMMIFGVALVKMSSCFGFRAADRGWGLAGLALWWAGLLARIVGWRMFYTADLLPDASRLFRLGGVLLALGALTIVVSLGIFERPKFTIRAHKFIRAAFAWLLVAGALLLVEPFHLSALHAPFSHAYTGAIRHAVTVGFISQMILGVGIHVIGRTHDLDDRSLSPLWAVFVLLNVGNAARVGLEIATDYRVEAFLPMGFTGFIELTALVLWAGAMVSPMLAAKRTKMAYGR